MKKKKYLYYIILTTYLSSQGGAKRSWEEPLNNIIKEYFVHIVYLVSVVYRYYVRTTYVHFKTGIYTYYFFEKITKFKTHKILFINNIVKNNINHFV